MMVRVVICWVGLSGYLAACWRALAARGDVQLSVITFSPSGRATPFDVERLTDGFACRVLDERERGDAELILSLAADARPDVVVIAGWAHGPYRRLPFARRLRGARFVMGMDTPWRGTARQRLARVLLRRYLNRMDLVVVPGERSWQYARALGVSEARVRRGVYGVNVEQMSPVTTRRQSAPDGWPRRFLFVGRYARNKGLDLLLEAYASYRVSVPDPWSLTCAGTGPLKPLLVHAPGVADVGFVQPADLPDVLARHGTFLLASREDPWPLVIVEAAAAGLPVVCSEACGSSVEMVRPYYNGITVPTGDVAALARAMRWVHAAHARMPEMGRRSEALAAAYGAGAWAERWHGMLSEITGR
jgi:glycosyltransferase involved in cell wall biosynthesis